MERAPASPPPSAHGGGPQPRVASPAAELGARQRRNGFERPFSRDQVVSCAGHSASALCFYVAAVGLLVARRDFGADRLFVLVRVCPALVSIAADR